MSGWFMWFGCALIGIRLIPTLSDFLPIDMWDWLMGRTHAGYYPGHPYRNRHGIFGRSIRRDRICRADCRADLEALRPVAGFARSCIFVGNNFATAFPVIFPFPFRFR